MPARDIPHLIVVGVMKQRAGAFDRFLLHEESNGIMQFPGGKVKTGEGLIEALKREFREEVAVDLENDPVLIAIEHVSTIHESTGMPLDSKALFFFAVAGGHARIDHGTWVSKAEVSSMQHRIPYDNVLIMSGMPAIHVGKAYTVPEGFADSPARQGTRHVRTFLWMRGHPTENGERC